MEAVKEVDPKEAIFIKGARLHNLKNIDVRIPRNQLVVITGMSGSGKSSLAFDTLYAEGQRRYVESLSSYARQFLGKLDKPKVDYIRGIAPAIAIEQKVNSTNPRSTVGTSTEVYDYIKLLYARIGKTISPVSGEEVRKHRVEDVIEHVRSFGAGSRLLLLAPIEIPSDRDAMKSLQLLSKQGYARIKHQGEVIRIRPEMPDIGRVFDLVVDRVVVKAQDEDFLNRLAGAVDTAFFEGKGSCLIEEVETGKRTAFSNRFERDGMAFPEPNVHLFSFNNPYGACPACEGYGDVIGIDEDLVVPNTDFSVYDNAIAPWKGESMGWYRDQLVNNAYKFDFPIHKPWYELTGEQRALVWEGNEFFTGLHDFFQKLEEKSYKIQNRVMLSRYRGKTRCSRCGGGRLRKEATYVQVGGKPINELVQMPVYLLVEFFDSLVLSTHQAEVAKRLLTEIRNRLGYLLKVGLGYLTLNRKSNTLSGGESQRINLATSLGSSLVGSMYILDEPSVGLHPRDSENLIQVLQSLRDLGNTVIVVEHDEEMMRAADRIIDIGPEAGTLGGEVVAEGNLEELLKADSYTAKYLDGRLEIPVPGKRRKPRGHIQVLGARQHNLANIDVTFPLQVLTVVTGVSGSGKSTLVNKILYPSLQKKLGGYGEKAGHPRSNPVTYLKAYDEIRNLFASQKLSKIRGYKAKHFSFNVDGGRCDKCKGEGEITVEMQFMADVHLECDQCQGKRFRKEILEVQFEWASIDDVLRMTVDEAIDFFSTHMAEKIASKLQPLQDVGLGYVTLGQPSSTLSGGEAQRIKLASFLGKGQGRDKALFIFDEPTTGLHFHDIRKLLDSFNALIDKGHSIIVIEHNIELIKSADHVIDLGPGGGDKGGHLVAWGTPEEVAANPGSITGKYLKGKVSE
jgi:excinuclease ABC subunit A